MSEYVTLLFAAWSIIMTGLYYKEREYRIDVLTDLTQLIYDYDVERDDLRRSLGYDEIEDYFEK